MTLNSSTRLIVPSRIQAAARSLNRAILPCSHACGYMPKQQCSACSSDMLKNVRWWPDATREDLYTAMLFTVCLFVWDDTIDTNEHVLASDFGKANLWRQQSLEYFKYHLKLSEPEKDEPYCPDNVCLLFKEFGERFCQSFGEGMSPSLAQLSPRRLVSTSNTTSIPWLITP